MQNIQTTATGVTHQIYATLLRLVRSDVDDIERDRGAVSLEQVLWFVAAGVSVGVISVILWNQVKDQADNVTITEPGIGG